MRHKLYVCFLALFIAAVALVGCAGFQSGNGSGGNRRPSTVPANAARSDFLGGILSGFRDAGSTLQAAGLAATPYAPHAGLILYAAGATIFGVCERYLRRKKTVQLEEQKKAEEVTRQEWDESEREKYRATGEYPPSKPPRPKAAPKTAPRKITVQPATAKRLKAA